MSIWYPLHRHYRHRPPSPDPCSVIIPSRYSTRRNYELMVHWALPRQLRQQQNTNHCRDSSKWWCFVVNNSRTTLQTTTWIETLSSSFSTTRGRVDTHGGTKVGRTRILTHQKKLYRSKIIFDGHRKTWTGFFFYYRIEANPLARPSTRLNGPTVLFSKWQWLAPTTWYWGGLTGLLNSCTVKFK